MTKHVASGLLVLAMAMIAVTHLTRDQSGATEVAAPILPTKVRDRVAATSLPATEGLELKLVFRSDEVEWSVPPIRENYLCHLDGRIGLLRERLALSPDQEGQVATWRAQVAQRLEKCRTGAEANGFATRRELEAFLRPLLDEEQAAALATFKREEQSQLAASLANSQFSRLAKAVGFSAELQVEVASDAKAVGPQAELRAEVAKIIAPDAEAVAAFRLDDPRPLEPFSSSFDKDPQALGVEQLIWEWLGEGWAALKVDHPRKRRFIKELCKRIDSRVASLKPVLTPGQLEDYRQYLRQNWAGNAWHQVLFPPLDPGG